MNRHEARCAECLDALARTLWLSANGDVPGYSGFWDGLPWAEKSLWVAEAESVVGGAQ